MGSYKNIKITTPEDIGIAEKMLEMSMAKNELPIMTMKKPEENTQAEEKSSEENRPE